MIQSGGGARFAEEAALSIRIRQSIGGGQPDRGLAAPPAIRRGGAPSPAPPRRPCPPPRARQELEKEGGLDGEGTDARDARWGGGDRKGGPASGSHNRHGTGFGLPPGSWLRHPVVPPGPSDGVEAVPHRRCP